MIPAAIPLFLFAIVIDTISPKRDALAKFTDNLLQLVPFSDSSFSSVMSTLNYIA